LELASPVARANWVLGVKAMPVRFTPAAVFRPSRVRTVSTKTG
jgi:hypothetical protein